ncbi:hypothetical protein F5Y15DRAFT_395994 [Xylariaceae sp. FL0016]|nr:hypothetical protein F5Y15DRAFT_395994 [Xylariaceae sp. FL0016]
MDREQLPYLTSVVVDNLRLSPATGPRPARIAPDEDMSYGPCRTLAGTPVGMITILMHRNQSLFPELMRFEPERWMNPGPGGGLRRYTRRFREAGGSVWEYIKITHVHLSIT